VFTSFNFDNAVQSGSGDDFDVAPYSFSKARGTRTRKIWMAQVPR
jgi:hypothetical protein